MKILHPGGAGTLTSPRMALAILSPFSPCLAAQVSCYTFRSVILHMRSLTRGQGPIMYPQTDSWTLSNSLRCRIPFSLPCPETSSPFSSPEIRCWILGSASLDTMLAFHFSFSVSGKSLQQKTRVIDYLTTVITVYYCLLFHV